ncbi:MAG: WD40/YVTN/BNR-like repeat-containing protein [Candidatus Hodarchaeota archaeon]
MNQRLNTKSKIVIISLIFGLSFLLLSYSVMSMNDFDLDDITTAYLGSLPVSHWHGEGSIFFLNESLGWYGGEPASDFGSPESIMIKTTDGGKTWRFLNVTTSQILEEDQIDYLTAKNVQFFNETHGLFLYHILTYDDQYIQYLVKTTDGGESWEYFQITNNAWGSYPIDIMHFFNYTHGIVSNYSGVLKTNDGGNSWNFYLNNLGLFKFDFINYTHGFALDHTDHRFGTIYFTNNSGVNWFQLSNLYIKCFDFLNTTHGWAIERVSLESYIHRIITTSDGGQTWEVQEIFEHHTTLARSFIYFTSENHGCATEGSGIYVTKDGGETWNYVDIESNWGIILISQIFLMDSNFGWILCVKHYKDKFGNLYPESLILKTIDGGESWHLNANFPRDIGKLSSRPIFSPIPYKNNTVDNIVLFVTIGGIVITVIGIIIVQRRQFINLKENKLVKKTSKSMEILTPSKEYIGISDSSLEIKLKDLIKSEIPIDSIKDENILNFLKREFDIVPVNEINRILKLNIPDIYDKLVILDEFTHLSPKERMEIINKLENLE